MILRLLDLSTPWPGPLLVTYRSVHTVIFTQLPTSRPAHYRYAFLCSKKGTPTLDQPNGVGFVHYARLWVNVLNAGLESCISPLDDAKAREAYRRTLFFELAWLLRPAEASAADPPDPQASPSAHRKRLLPLLQNIQKCREN